MSGLTEEQIVLRLRATGSVFAEDEARLLVAEASAQDALESLVARRESGVPLEHVLGWALFDGLRILVDERVFVPRRRTGLLVREAAALAVAGDIVVDLCCGTGAVGAALAERVPGIEVHAADIDPAAVTSAHRNLDARGGAVWQGDLFDALPATLRGRIGVLAVNAPYVPAGSIGLMPPEARLHENLVALDGGGDGLDVHRRVAADAGVWLRPGGHLLVETSERQAPLTAGILETQGLASRIVHDDDLDATVVIGVAVRS